MPIAVTDINFEKEQPEKTQNFLIIFGF